MANTKFSEQKCREVEEAAASWGKLLAQEAFPSGPGLDISLADMEEIVARASQSLVSAAVKTMSDDQAAALDDQQPCPTCGRLCEMGRKERRVAVRGGTAQLSEPVAHCSTCRRDFFPSTPRAAD